MKDMDFIQCEFIDNTMKFLTYNDFCKDRIFIKANFILLDKNAKLFYKWYIYANIHMNETYKNAIWDYLNDYDENGFELLRLLKFYKVK